MIENLLLKIYKISEFKVIELQIYLTKMYFNGLDLSIDILGDRTYFRTYLDLYFLKFDLDFSRKCDHPGVRFNFSIFNFNFDINQYDTRHWDDEKQIFI